MRTFLAAIQEKRWDHEETYTVAEFQVFEERDNMKAGDRVSFVLESDVRELVRLADNLVASDGHSQGCSFSGCSCGRTELYKSARAEYLRYRRNAM